VSDPLTESAGGREPRHLAATSRSRSIGHFGRAYETYAILLLMLVQALSILDRSVINILAEPIRHEFHLRDWQLGALTGSAFAIFYTVLGIPIARVAEHANRSLVIAASIVLWSLATMAAGLVSSFVQLAISRLMVGVGEAGCSPAAYSLITEVVPRERRTSAIALYSVGISVGTFLGMAVGGFVADAYGWRMAFIVAGAPGLVIGLLVAVSLVEPRTKVRADAPQEVTPSLGVATRELVSKRVFWLVALATGVLSLNGYARAAFITSFYLRTASPQVKVMADATGGLFGKHVGSMGFLGLALGIATGVFGILGTLWGGWLTDRWARRDMRAYVYVPLVTTIVYIPCGLAILLVPNVAISLLCACVTGFFASAGVAPVFASIQTIVHPRTRATASSALIFIINIVGLALGPLLLGLVSDALSSAGLQGGEGLRWALICAQLTGLVSIVLYWLASFRFLREVVA